MLAGAPPINRDSVAGLMPSDPGYAWQHGLYWLACNLSADSPLVLLVDDLQWCDAPSARALAFIARRLAGQPLALILATRPLDPAQTPEAASIVTEAATEVLRPSPLTSDAVAAMIAARLRAEASRRFVGECIEATGGNPFLLGELLDEVAARGFDPTSSASAEVTAIVPRGVANAVLLRLARLAPQAGTLARALSVLGDRAQVGDAASLAGLAGAEPEQAMASLVSAGVIESGGTVLFTHPILRAAIYGDLSAAERERLHCAASKALSARGAPAGQVAAHVMHTEPANDQAAVTLLREAATAALALGDAAGAAAMLARALDEPPADGDRPAVVLELGRRGRARARRTPSLRCLRSSSEVMITGRSRLRRSSSAGSWSSPAGPRTPPRSCTPRSSASRSARRHGPSSTSPCWERATRRRRPDAPPIRRSRRSGIPAARQPMSSRPRRWRRWRWTS